MNLANRLKRIEEQIKPSIKGQDSEWDMSALSTEELKRLLQLIDQDEFTDKERLEIEEYLQRCRRGNYADKK